MLVQFVHVPTCTLQISKATLRQKWRADPLWWLINMTVLPWLTSVSVPPSHLDFPWFSGETSVYSLSALLKPFSPACSVLLCVTFALTAPPKGRAHKRSTQLCISFPPTQCSSSTVMKPLHPLSGPSNSQTCHTRECIQTCSVAERLFQLLTAWCYLSCPSPGASAISLQ